MLFYLEYSCWGTILGFKDIKTDDNKKFTWMETSCFHWQTLLFSFHSLTKLPHLSNHNSSRLNIWLQIWCFMKESNAEIFTLNTFSVTRCVIIFVFLYFWVCRPWKFTAAFQDENFSSGHSVKDRYLFNFHREKAAKFGSSDGGGVQRDYWWRAITRSPRWPFWISGLTRRKTRRATTAELQKEAAQLKTVIKERKRNFSVSLSLWEI